MAVFAPTYRTPVPLSPVNAWDVSLDTDVNKVYVREQKKKKKEKENGGDKG